MLLALAMGVQNAAAQRLAVPDLTTTVLTRTLTGLASEASIVGGPGSKLGRRVLAVGAMLLGAFVGALLALKVSIALPLAIALALVASTGLAVHLLSRSAAPGRAPSSQATRLDWRLIWKDRRSAGALVVAAVAQPCRDVVRGGDQMRAEVLDEPLQRDHRAVRRHADGRDHLARLSAHRRRDREQPGRELLAAACQPPRRGSTELVAQRAFAGDRRRPLLSFSSAISSRRSCSGRWAISSLPVAVR